MNFEGVLRRLESNQRIFSRWMLLVILCMIVAVFLLVWFTGGIKFVFSHSMYVPILLGGLFFGLWDGLAAGILAMISLENAEELGISFGLGSTCPCR